MLKILCQHDSFHFLARTVPQSSLSVCAGGGPLQGPEEVSRDLRKIWYESKVLLFYEWTENQCSTFYVLDGLLGHAPLDVLHQRFLLHPPHFAAVLVFGVCATAGAPVTLGAQRGAGHGSQLSGVGAPGAGAVEAPVVLQAHPPPRRAHQRREVAHSYLFSLSDGSLKNAKNEKKFHIKIASTHIYIF